jgi:hypothetical protein
MKLNEFIRSVKVWTSNEEDALLEKINDLRPLNTFDDRDQVIIDSLIRKSLLIKVESKGSVYIYPNV